MRVDFQQMDMTNVDWPAMVWNKGANTVLLTGTEVGQVSGISEQDAVSTEFLEIAQRRQNHRIARAWRAAYPTVDMTVHGDHMRGTDLKRVMNVTRKLAALSLTFDTTGINVPLQLPAVPGMKKVILRGALPALKMPHMQATAQARVAEDILSIFKLSSKFNDLNLPLIPK